nr:VOC family protein [uncultured Agathobaculum sp.]
MVQYRMPVLAVRDIEISKQFYHDLFDQEVTLDLGANVTLSGGFALQEDFDELADIPKSTILHQSNNMELYFETEDFDAFLEKLHDFLDIELVHPPKMHEWHQRVVRLYDPDWHIVEVGESMEVVAQRLLREGYDVAQIAKLTQMPEPFVEQCRKGLE